MEKMVKQKKIIKFALAAHSFAPCAFVILDGVSDFLIY